MYNLSTYNNTLIKPSHAFRVFAHTAPPCHYIRATVK